MIDIRPLRLNLGTIMGSALLLAAPLGRAQFYQQVNLVTDDQSAYPAKITDPNLVNAWGVSFSGSSPFWVSGNGSGVRLQSAEAAHHLHHSESGIGRRHGEHHRQSIGWPSL